jgi:cold shock protein
MKQRATVKFFNVDKGYGFLAVDNGPDVFVGIGSVVGATKLTKGDKILFELGQDRMGRPRAKIVGVAQKVCIF